MADLRASPALCTLTRPSPPATAGLLLPGSAVGGWNYILIMVAGEQAKSRQFGIYAVEDTDPPPRWAGPVG